MFIYLKNVGVVLQDTTQVETVGIQINDLSYTVRV